MDSVYEMQNDHSQLLMGGSTFNLKVDTELLMTDGKMVDIIQEDSGSFCHYFSTTRKVGLVKTGT